MPQKFLCVFLVLLPFISQNAQAKNYNGHGFWKNSGGLGGAYQANVEVTPQNFSSSYVDAFGENVRHIKMVGSQEDFEIIVNDQYKGKGFCFNNFCNLGWSEGTDKMEESWFFDNNEKIIRMGRRSYDTDKYVLWQDQVE